MPQDDHLPEAGNTEHASERHVDPLGKAKLRPFQTIWTSPRSTVRSILAVNPRLHVVLLACLGGVAHWLDRAGSRDAGDTMTTLGILGLAIVVGPLGGLFWLWIGSFLIRLVGKWIGGTASQAHIQTAMAWASVPGVCGLLLWIPLLLFIGGENFTSATPIVDASPTLTVLAVGIGIVDAVLSIWGLVLLCHTIAEVQGFRSAWRGLANVLLMLLPLVGFALVFALVATILA